MDDIIKKEISELLYLALEREIKEQQTQRLNTLLKSDEQYIYFAVSFLQLATAMKYSKKVSAMKEPIKPELSVPEIFPEFLSVLAENECTSPAIETGQVSVEKNANTTRLFPVLKNRINYLSEKLTKIYVITSIAAILFLGFNVYLSLQPQTVATIINSVEARWTISGLSAETGTRLKSRQQLKLARGVVKILFDGGAEVLLEAPAEIKLENHEKMDLITGKLYARIQENALGFIIDTPSARVIDLGTEFGVSVDNKGLSSISMFKGQAMFSGIANGRITKGEMLATGQAKKTDGSGSVKDAVFTDKEFIRDINSNGYLWYGQGLNLADIFSGGDGFGKVMQITGINPGTGAITSAVVRDTRITDRLYCNVSENELIDGVFVPDSKNKDITIDSNGNKTDFLGARGYYTHEIAVYHGDIKQQQSTIPPLVFNNTQYDDHDIVMLHSNCGITIDLMAIRKKHPGFTLKEFRSQGGITEALRNVTEKKPYIDFTILIDGQVEYCTTGVSAQSGKMEYAVELGPQDEFMTLMVTDCPELSDTVLPNYGYENDFFYLIDPQIVIDVNSISE
ncbi:MAG: FecR domain-containing protein [Sedimentisphaerales bacterium]|nr:FecR domain-containing protein [Sedimentisphaerales bacterium]MBN2842245.1 FecR domain-containing protein [Sedimentisphaerales bacterium]